MKNQIFLLLGLFLLLSCSKEAKLKKEFINKVWIIDSIKSHSLDRLFKNKGSLRSFNNILKPKEEGIFDVYQDQTCKFQSFKISNDTIYLEIYSKQKVPFKLEKVNKYTSKLVSLDKKFKEYEYYITDITDLFNGNIKNDSKLYNQIKDYTWFPTKLVNMGEIVMEEEKPEYYIKDYALQINNNKLQYSSFFKESNLVKVTEKGIYFFNTKKKELLDVYVIDVKANKLKLYENNTRASIIDYKKIESTVLIDKKDLPKKVRLGCSEFLAKYSLENKIQSTNSDFYFDKTSIRLINENDNDCEYTYTIVYQSKEFRDINSTKTIKVSFTEDEKINFKFIQ